MYAPYLKLNDFQQVLLFICVYLFNNNLKSTTTSNKIFWNVMNNNNKNKNRLKDTEIDYILKNSAIRTTGHWTALIHSIWTQSTYYLEISLYMLVMLHLPINLLFIFQPVCVFICLKKKVTWKQKVFFFLLKYYVWLYVLVNFTNTWRFCFQCRL